MPRLRLSPRKQPRQARSRATVEVILAAATRVLARESLAGFNTNRVAEVAGISVGSFYQYFPNKEALMAALIEQAQTAMADALDAALARSAGSPLAAALEAVAQMAIEQQYGQALLAAAIDHEERRLPVQASLRKGEARLLEAAARLLLRHAAELPASLPKAAPRDCLVITKALVEADMGHARSAPPDLAERVLRALLGYLQGPAGAPPHARGGRPPAFPPPSPRTLPPSR